MSDGIDEILMMLLLEEDRPKERNYWVFKGLKIKEVCLLE